jgi:hypothetical protein
MDIKMQTELDPKYLTCSKWDLSFIGRSNDKRGEKATEFISSKSSDRYFFKYIPREFKIILNDDEFDKDDINVQLENMKRKKVLVDSTTLNFAEILILTQALKNTGLREFDILYVEAGNYNRKSEIFEILRRREFELSESIIGYEAIPGHALLVTSEIQQKIVFLCGYEGERLDLAFEDSEIIGSNCSCIFGVPAFNPGWEMDSFDNNISVLKDRRITGGVTFCPAANPLSVFQTLEMKYRGLADDEQMFVVPLATKPMNIGACLFLLSKPKDKVAVLYDHPNEIKGKAIEVSNWHLFNVKF